MPCRGCQRPWRLPYTHPCPWPLHEPVPLSDAPPPAPVTAPPPAPVAAPAPVPVPAPAPVSALQLAADPRWLAIADAEWGSKAQARALLALWQDRAHVDERALRQLAGRTLPAERRAALQGKRPREEGPEADAAHRLRSLAQRACSDMVNDVLRAVYGQRPQQWVGVV